MDNNAPKPKRFLRFRLLTLLILGPIVAILGSWAFQAWRADRLHQQAVEAIEKRGGQITRNEQNEVVAVHLPGEEIDNPTFAEIVRHLQAFPKLESLALTANQVTDDGLQQLARLPQLKTAYIVDTGITAAGVAAMQRRMPGLAIERAQPDIKASGLAAQPIYKRAALNVLRSPQGQLIASDGHGNVHIFHPGSQRPANTFRAHEEWTFALAFHPQGRMLATAGGDGLIKLWDWPSQRLLGQLEGHSDDVHALAFTPDGNTLVSTGDDWTVRMWDVVESRSGMVSRPCQLTYTLTGHEGTIPGLALSPDGSTAASASRDGTIRLWDVNSGKHLATLRGHADDVMSVAFHPTQPLLASASYDRSVKLWDLTSQRAVKTIEQHNDWVFSVAWSPDGNSIATAAGDGTRRFDARSGKLLWHEPQPKNVSHVAWLTPSLLATSSADGSLTIRESNTGRERLRYWLPSEPGT